MKTAHTTQPKPAWVIEQEQLGRTVIHNAPRPLYGDATENSWGLPFLHGRHYAALDPSGRDYEVRASLNEQNDACIVVYVSEQEAWDKGVAWYRSKFAEERLTAVEMEEYRDHVIKRGLELMDAQAQTAVQQSGNPGTLGE